eukprot:CAMPEP_0182796804 /NCGR_PEP_ID=MMETSP0006_2-20121128/471_1 /TAXON_ID=97485 /ORGANISM="Prymnesium parvum, Strain Texoma1" /LENGTH=76 /DNA_ID=CAMNT_0024921797 /DNA_START=146 /DNA_END=372 /DNA_ORIENTATION=-
MRAGVPSRQTVCGCQRTVGGCDDGFLWHQERTALLMSQNGSLAGWTTRRDRPLAIDEESPRPLPRVPAGTPPCTSR